MSINLRNKWSNAILHLSSFVSRKKDDILVLHGIKGLWNILIIICAEIILLFISLPSYIALRSKNTKSISKEYSLRRALTLSSISIVLIIWILKCIIILFLVWHTHTYGNLDINETKDRKANTETLTLDMIIANVDQKLSAPSITEVESSYGNINIKGSAIPQSGVAIIFTEKEKRTGNKTPPPKIYSTESDKNGYFNLHEDANLFNLPQGTYDAHALTYDPIHKTKSAESRTFTFTVSRSWSDVLFHTFDSILNIIALIAIIIGLLATILVS